jgi:hypothetical protein
VAEGLQLFENVLDSSETNQLTLLINGIQAAGRKGRTSVGSTRGFNGQGRDTIHFGCQHPEAHSKFSASMTLPIFLLPLSSLFICQSGCNFSSVSVFDDFNQLLPSFFQF